MIKVIWIFTLSLILFEVNGVLEDAVFSSNMVPIDNRGERVHAHAGGLRREADGQFLWIGEGEKRGCNTANIARGAGCVNQEDEVSQGFNLYSSSDLVSWASQGVVLRRGDVLDAACFPTCRMERPKLLRTPAGTYVILFHVARLDFSYNAVGVATAPAAAGPYQYMKSFLPNGMPSFDMNIYEDADGRTYLARSLGTQPIVMISELTSDFMNVGDTCTSLSGSRGEAPAIFRPAANVYMMLVSGQTWWDSNPATLAATSRLCPPGGQAFSAITQPVDGPGAVNTLDSQPLQVLSFPCSNGRSFFMYMGDRWNFRGPGGLAAASYVWLPMVQRSPNPADGFAIMDRAEWSPREYCGLPSS